jgi:hypothetical protein
VRPHDKQARKSNDEDASAVKILSGAQDAHGAVGRDERVVLERDT